jgi:protease-4
MNKTDPSQKPQDSFIKKQLKLAASTFTITTIGTLTLTFWLNLSVMILGFFLIMMIIAAAAGSTETMKDPIYQTTYGRDTATHKILSLPIDGPIEGSKSGIGPASIFGVDTTVYGYDLKRELIKAADSDEYDGVVLEVNSPGGAIYGAKAIADGVKYFKETTKKPVYASVQGLSASGSYWVSASADKIIADSGTGIGSIGVIYGPFTYFDKVTAIDGGILGGGVTTENGIEQEYITAGEGKDAGNPFRRLTDKEKAIIQQGVNDAYEQFVQYVSAQRGIAVDVIKNEIGAHLYSDNQALQKKLIDGIGSRDEVYDQLAKQAGIQADYRVVSSHVAIDDFWSSLNAKLVGKGNKTTTNIRPQICTGSVTTPLALEATPSQFCSKN